MSKLTRGLVILLLVVSILGQFNQDLNYAIGELNMVDKLESIIQYMAHHTHQYPIDRWLIFKIAAGLLMNLTGLQVRLISQRNGPQGEMIDKTLSRIEEKSYQLKTMLIQLQQDKRTPVTYFPEEAAYNFRPVPQPGSNLFYRQPYTYG